MPCFQNTYTNADKLLEAAEQLAQTGECDPEEIYKAARHLEVRIQDFVRRVEQRKLLLDMSVSFHTHTKEVRLLTHTHTRCTAEECEVFAEQCQMCQKNMLFTSPAVNQTLV